jgi:hypothetical protein
VHHFDRVRVGADQDPQPVLLDPANDRAGSGFGAFAWDAVEQAADVQVAVRAGGFGDIGLDDAGVQAADLYGMSGVGHLLGERLGEAADGELRGVVCGLVRERDESGDARDVDEVAIAGSDQVRQERFAAVQDPPEVDAHQPLPVLPAGVEKVRDHVDAGVIDDEVDLPEVGGDFMSVGLHRVALRDVERVAVRFDAELLARGRGLLSVGGVDVGDGELGAAAGELERERPADPRPGARDDGDLLVEVLHGAVLLR